MQSPMPQCIEDIDRDWLSRTLEREVTDFRTSIVEGGVLASTYRVNAIRIASQSISSPIDP